MTWDEVEAAARADVMARTPEPLSYGQRVLWTEMTIRAGWTDGLSAVHRVMDLEGEPDVFDGHTFCGLTIPPELRRLPLNLSRVVDRCIRCEIAAAKAREDAIHAVLAAKEAIRWPA